jgi:hypothetical protein
MGGWGLGLLEVAPVAIVVVIVVRHFRAQRRAAADADQEARRPHA